MDKSTKHVNCPYLEMTDLAGGSIIQREEIDNGNVDISEIHCVGRFAVFVSIFAVCNL